MAGRIWTEEDINYLREKWGLVSVDVIAQKLNRTVISVRKKASYLKLGKWIDNIQYIKFRELIMALGYSESGYCYLKKKFKLLNFPMISKKVSKMKVEVVDIEEFWKWAEKNKSELNFANFNEGVLGKEPNWVKEKRKSDQINPAKVNVKKRWTKEEDNLLIAKVKSNTYTYKMISEDLFRTESAIKRRLMDLNVPYRPIPEGWKPWSEEEENKAIMLREKGYDCFAIGRILGRTQMSVDDKLRSYF
ncbi:hypothetical protein JJB61_07275 [Clostridium perfringens]|uniref:Myb-like domain-containing protein n=1 Tax=Clostridium perfringens TaxID=1502 RepID=A0ABD4PP56_CLOPF|nr:hypothetical protein [Clostridium perfringens]DAP32271.1 MAG TPA: DNA-binding protein [Caudoviricetes sp.]ELC8344297.1 hypothetical protein [Clostridium perfringens]MBO3384833.1 hypothetical protein [Clostridium perfringens]MBO3397250.1 hypothetical protein [Clostridium perfringens]MBO3416810.1 hypothetical protein [Clostridium perfringens]